jgi:hypothetical protein
MKTTKQLEVQTAIYSAPQVTTHAFAVEAGFSLSDELGLPGETPDVNDFGEF